MRIPSPSPSPSLRWLLLLSIFPFYLLLALESSITNNDEKTTIHIAIVSCGAVRAPEALASMRSALLTATQPLHFYIFHQANDGNDAFFTNALQKWKQSTATTTAATSFEFDLYTSDIPEHYSKLFAPCACQRLFLHEALPATLHHVLYMDSDTLVLTDLSTLWRDFVRATAHSPPVLAALVAEHTATADYAYYTEQTVQHPYFSSSTAAGLNSGVLLLDLDKLRAAPWNEQFASYLEQYQLQFFDQDLLNIYFAQHAEKLQELPCEWNFRPDHCFFSTQHCSKIGILHGNRGSLHAPANEQAAVYSVDAFQTLYKAFSLFPATELGSVAAVRDAWTWFWGSSASAVADQARNYCDVTVPSVVTQRLLQAAALANAAKQQQAIEHYSEL